jgi:hypothetical protein
MARRPTLGPTTTGDDLDARAAARTATAPPYGSHSGAKDSALDLETTYVLAERKFTAHSPYLSERRRLEKHWIEINVLGSGYVTGWRSIALSTLLGAATCVVAAVFVEPAYPSAFPISTFPFTAFTLFLGPLFGVFVGWNVAKYTRTLLLYKKACMKATAMSWTFAGGMRNKGGPRVAAVRHILAAIPFVIKHEVRTPTTVPRSPLFTVDDNDDEEAGLPEPSAPSSCPYKGLSEAETASLKRLQEQASELAAEKGLGGRIGKKPRLKASLLPWPARLRAQALSTGVVSTPSAIAFLRAKLDDAAAETGNPIPERNALSGLEAQLIDLYNDLRHNRNSRVPVAVSNTMFVATWLYLIFLPLALWGLFGWWSILAHALVSAFMLGILSSVANVANPFNRYHSSNAVYVDVGMIARRAHSEVWHAFDVAYHGSDDLT